MDRFQWLRSQRWLIPWQSSSADSPKWLFQGYASFYASAAPQDDAHDDEDGALSEDSAHLFFSAPAPPLDPAQLAMKLGVADDGTGKHSSCSSVVISFDESEIFSIDLHQVISISKWNCEKGCKTCRSSSLSEKLSIDKTCACQCLPSYMTVRLKHLSMVIYSSEQPNEFGLPNFFGAMELFNKVLNEETSPSGEREIRDVKMDDYSVSDFSNLITSTDKLLQEFLCTVDCMSECAVKAVDVCSADTQWMSKLLSTMINHAADNKNLHIHLKSIECQIRSCMKVLEEEEQTCIAAIWGSNSKQQQGARTAAIVTLQKTIEKQKHLEEALSRIHLMSCCTL